MTNYKYLFGPVPSRRLGKSLGISPIPFKTCNYSCVYCQLGRTDNISNERVEFFLVSEIIDELKSFLMTATDFDIVTIVGEGEPTLYLKLGELIRKIKKLTNKPVAVITNGSLLANRQVREELLYADIVLPSLDAYDEKSFKSINRPYGSIEFKKVIEGYKMFSKEYEGQVWIEVMLIRDVNDSKCHIEKIHDILNTIKYDKLYINTPVRPPSEDYVKEVTSEVMDLAVDILGGISIDRLVSGDFISDISDDYDALISIIKRHPMNQYEISNFLERRRNLDTKNLFSRLESDSEIRVLNYKGYKTYRYSNLWEEIHGF